MKNKKLLRSPRRTKSRRTKWYSRGAVFFIFIGAVIAGVGAAKQQAAIGAFGGVFIAIAGSLFGLWVQSRKESIDTSKFYLDSCTSGMKQVSEIMKEVDKTHWIAAKRMVRQISKMYGNLTEEEHKSVFWMHHATYSLEISRLLGRKRREPWIYFGKSTQPGPSALYFAAQESTPRPDTAEYEVAGSSEKFFPISALKALHQFVELSEPDPDEPVADKDERDITTVGHNRLFSYLERERMTATYPGLYQYLLMHDTFHFLEGKILRRSDGSEVRPNDSDFQQIASANHSHMGA